VRPQNEPLVLCVVMVVPSSRRASWQLNGT
jgi:hypothetical protein